VTGRSGIAFDEVEPWRMVATELEAIHRARVNLDGRELGLLVEAEECGVYRMLGYPTMAAYMIARLDCTRHTANEKLRVAYELIDLPLIDAEVRAGTLSWAKVRELTRVVTEETEEAWLDAIDGKDSNQVQQMVKGLKKGSLPADRPDPDLVTEWVGLEVPARIAAMWRQMRIALDDEAGRRLSDAELCEEIAKRATAEVTAPGEVPRPGVQIAITTCRQCKQAHQVGPGVEYAISVSDYERALCDAVFIGDLEADDPQPNRTSIPQATRRKVLVRDRFCCTVPGCTSKRFLVPHHIKHREHGGDNKSSNITTLCDGHHKLLHDGIIAVRGKAPDRLVFTLPAGPDGT
jgi:hypothetical protein